MEQNRMDTLLVKRDLVQKAAKSIIDMLVAAGFTRKNFSFWNGSIILNPLRDPIICIEASDSDLTIKVESKIVTSDTHERLKKLAAEKGWLIQES